ncbi:hypothetical protein [Dyadobacter sp. CY312]|uniref:hypothetical protein n=1 Tax=Dyadobacter sp. CY312 TaxID=2907303 RepID=UPI001F35DF83|nr:hypothetical protein [Dyadobacter sp. CY312]MCE7039174.1 hypothetical protein [Dyadobacter sp. CY312]
MNTIPEITQREFEILAHSLGVALSTAKRSGRKSDKRLLPEEFYRNRFIASPTHNDYPTLIILKGKGFMNVGENYNSRNDLLFYVTDLGKFKFRQEFKTFINS